MVRKTKDGWVVLSKEGKKLGGPYRSEKRANERLKQIEYFKHEDKGKK